MRFVRMIFALFLLSAGSLLLNAASNSADVPHLHVQLVVPAQTLEPGQVSQAGLYFKLEPGWHVYWKNAGDSGEPPHIKWTLPAGVTAGALQFPAPSRLPLGPLMDFGYENEVLFPFPLKIAPGITGPANLHAKVDWLVCREVCIPGKAELELSRQVGSSSTSPVEPDASLYKRLSERLPVPEPQSFRAGFRPTPTGFRLTVLTGRKEDQAQFFPVDQNVLDNPAPQPARPESNGISLDLKKDPNSSSKPNQLKGVIELSGGRNFEIAAFAGPPAPPLHETAESAPLPSITPVSSATPASSPGSEKESPGLFRIIALAFVGGLILNLMPCVFPVLFLKGLALMQSGSEERNRLRNHGLVYTAGILTSFWLLVAVLLGLRSAGTHLGWGFQFQSPVFLSLMAGLLFFLGLSLAGQFEIGLSLTSAGGSLAARNGYTGSFFTGVLAVIVATPCTAPFMGAAIGYALAQPAAITFGVFTALALGLAAPYFALTLQPAWTKVLPRPGAWMEVLRQAISVPIFATVIWLIWVLAQAYGATLLAAVLSGLLIMAMAGWFLGRWPAQRWSATIAACLILTYVALSSWAPGKLASAPQAASARTAAGGVWEPWSADAVARYQSQGRPVFVDFTASWCLSCQVNERVALSQPHVRRAFADANVALLRADWTQHDDAITQTLTSLGRSGVPAYALYQPGVPAPRLLPEVLTPSIVTDALNQLPRGASRAGLERLRP